MIWIRQIAEDAGATEPVNGSWLIAWANELGVTQPVNGTWWEAIGQHLGLTPVNGSWIEAVAIEYGQPTKINGTWIEAIANGSAKQPAAFVIMAGQSNMRGQGTPFPAEYQGNITGVKIWNGSAFVTLNGSVSNNNQLGQPLGTFGPEMSFLKELLNDYEEVYCVKYAIGGTSLATAAQGGTASNWNPATVGSLFDTLVGYVNSAQALLPAEYTDLGLFWFQGEKDSETNTMAYLYYNNLGLLFNDFKTETGIADLKFYISLICSAGTTSGNDHTGKTRVAQIGYAYDNRANDVYLIDTDSLTFESDLTHLTQQGYVDCGLLYYNATNTNPANRTLVITENFPGSTLSNPNWSNSGTSAGVGVSVSGNALRFACPHTSNIPFETGRLVISRYGSEDIPMYGRSKISWTDPSTSSAQGAFYCRRDASNYIAVMNDITSVGGNFLRIRKRQGGVNTDIPTSMPNGSEVKIFFNPLNGSYSISHWNGSAWVVIDSGTLSFTGASTFTFTVNDATTVSGGDQFIFEEFDHSIIDFTTRRP